MPIHAYYNIAQLVLKVHIPLHKAKRIVAPPEVRRLPNWRNAVISARVHWVKSIPRLRPSLLSVRRKVFQYAYYRGEHSIYTGDHAAYCTFQESACHIHIFLKHDNYFLLHMKTLLMLALPFMLHRYCGFILHAGSVRYQDGRHRTQGVVFAGRSGAGKTTLVRLFARYAQGIELDDDIVVIRKIKHTFRVFNLPWYRNGVQRSVLQSPMTSIFCVHHAQNNNVHLLRIPDKILAMHKFKLYYGIQAMSKSRRLDAITQLLEVPMYGYGFVANRSAVSFLKSFLRKQNA